MATYPVGQMVFFDHVEHSWIQGEITESPNAKGVAKVADKSSYNSGTSEANLDQLYPISNTDILTEDCHDLLHLSELHNSTLLSTLRRRYMNDVVYTYIGPIVIALNPFNYNIPWYKDDFMPNYLAEGESIVKNKPHSWSVAHNTYYEMRNDRCNQSVLVSGESGAGKTEAVKIVIKYLRGLMGKLAKDDAHRAELEEVNKKVLLASPILESFGNAKTGRNDNSSRFGKFLQVQFDNAGFIAGSFAINYLIERSRVTTAAQGERVFHAFYQVAKGKDAAKYKLTAPADYPSLVSGKTIDNASMEDAAGEDLSYRISNECFDVCGIPADQVDAVWRNVAAVLHLAKVEFEEDGPEASKIPPASEQCIAVAAELWRVPADKLQIELLQTILEIKGQTMTIQHPKPRATVVLQTLAKSIYKGLFDWLFVALNATTAAAAPANWIGLLDIFGFEDFPVNSFEQLCINLANETLQNHYNDYIFNKDMLECKSEGVDVTSIEFADNTITCRLLTDKLGIFALLDEECSLGKGSDLGFLEKIANQHGKHTSFYKTNLMKTDFGVKHYAGMVKYQVENFLEKNRETLKDAFKFLFRNESTCDITKTLLPEPVDKKGKPPTVSGVFVRQINELMDLINSTNPHWIRCIKPHPAKKPLMFHGALSMGQMVSAGIMETVRIRMLGFPVRLPHAAFIARFAILAKAKGKPATPQGIIEGAGFAKELMQVGATKVFMKSAAYLEIEVKKREALLQFALTAQSYARCVGALLKSTRMRKQLRLKWLQSELREWLAKSAELRRQRQEERERALAAVRDQLNVILADEATGRGGIGTDQAAAFAAIQDASRDALRAAVHKVLAGLEGVYDSKRASLVKEEQSAWATSLSDYHDTMAKLAAAEKARLAGIAERFAGIKRQLFDDEQSGRRAIAAEEAASQRQCELALDAFSQTVLESIESSLRAYNRLAGRTAVSYVASGLHSPLSVAAGGGRTDGPVLPLHTDSPLGAHGGDVSDADSDSSGDSRFSARRVLEAAYGATAASGDPNGLLWPGGRAVWPPPAPLPPRAGGAPAAAAPSTQAPGHQPAPLSNAAVNALAAAAAAVAAAGRHQRRRSRSAARRASPARPAAESPTSIGTASAGGYGGGYAAGPFGAPTGPSRQAALPRAGLSAGGATPRVSTLVPQSHKPMVASAGAYAPSGAPTPRGGADAPAWSQPFGLPRHEETIFRTLRPHAPRAHPVDMQPHPSSAYGGRDRDRAHGTSDDTDVAYNESPHTTHTQPLQSPSGRGVAIPKLPLGDGAVRQDPHHALSDHSDDDRYHPDVIQQLRLRDYVAPHAADGSAAPTPRVRGPPAGGHPASGSSTPRWAVRNVLRDPPGTKPSALVRVGGSGGPHSEFGNPLQPQVRSAARAAPSPISMTAAGTPRSGTLMIVMPDGSERAFAVGANSTFGGVVPLQLSGRASIVDARGGRFLPPGDLVIGSGVRRVHIVVDPVYQ